MFISNGISYLPVICPNNEDIDTYPKVILNSAGEWKPSDLDDDEKMGRF